MTGDYDSVALIHGAWQGAWAWERLTPLLRRAGLSVLAVDLPRGEVSLADYLDHIGGRIARLDGKVSLVGHSGGGMVATAAAEAFCERVARVAYVAGMMLPSGMTFAQLRESMAEEVGAAPGVVGELIWSADGQTSRVPAPAARAIFYHDCPPDLAAAAAQKLTPQHEGGRALQVSWTAERFGALPRLYVEATEDRSLPLALQRRMQALTPGAEVMSLPTGHAPQLSAPETLAQALIPFLQAHPAHRSRP